MGDTIKTLPRAVLDTNVLVSALRSNRGASFALLLRVAEGEFKPSVSVPLVLEYEDALTRQVVTKQVTEKAVLDILDYLCSVSEHHKIHYLWRPHLRDPKDDMVLELALAAQCDYIVTHNLADFKISTQGILRVVTPAEFLRILEQRQ